MEVRAPFAASLIANTNAAAAAEMALVTPLLLILMFGAFELGNFFLNEHALAKAVRDGARYAARQSFTEYDSGACTISPDAEAKTRRLTRTGQLAVAGADGRIRDWDEADEASTITVSVICNSSGSYSGIYVNNGGVAAAVTVNASVGYTPLLGGFGFDASGLVLNAYSQAPVTGI